MNYLYGCICALFAMFLCEFFTPNKSRNFKYSSKGEYIAITLLSWLGLFLVIGITLGSKRIDKIISDFERNKQNGIL